MGAVAFDPLGMIEVLNRHGVRYVVIGGIAAGVQGVAWATRDLDICHARSRANLRRLAAALEELVARPVELPEGVAVRLDAGMLAARDRWTLTSRLGRLDCLGEPAPGLTFETLAERGRTFQGSQTYVVASLEDLITMKGAAGRPRDVAQIEMLRAAIDEARARSSASDD